MKAVIGWLTAGAIFASPCAWDTSQRELLERLQPTSLASNIHTTNPTTSTLKEPQ